VVRGHRSDRNVACSGARLVLIDVLHRQIERETAHRGKIQRVQVERTRRRPATSHQRLREDKRRQHEQPALFHG
jgi:hypothetical protein